MNNDPNFSVILLISHLTDIYVYQTSSRFSVPHQPLLFLIISLLIYCDLQIKMIINDETKSFKTLQGLIIALPLRTNYDST